MSTGNIPLDILNARQCERIRLVPRQHGLELQLQNPNGLAPTDEYDPAKLAIFETPETKICNDQLIASVRVEKTESGYQFYSTLPHGARICAAITALNTILDSHGSLPVRLL